MNSPEDDSIQNFGASPSQDSGIYPDDLNEQGDPDASENFPDPGDISGGNQQVSNAAGGLFSGLPVAGPILTGNGQAGLDGQGGLLSNLPVVDSLFRGNQGGLMRRQETDGLIGIVNNLVGSTGNVNSQAGLVDTGGLLNGLLGGGGGAPGGLLRRGATDGLVNVPVVGQALGDDGVGGIVNNLVGSTGNTNNQAGLVGTGGLLNGLLGGGGGAPGGLLRRGATDGLVNVPVVGPALGDDGVGGIVNNLVGSTGNTDSQAGLVDTGGLLNGLLGGGGGTPGGLLRREVSDGLVNVPVAGPALGEDGVGGIVNNLVGSTGNTNNQAGLVGTGGLLNGLLGGGGVAPGGLLRREATDGLVNLPVAGPALGDGRLNGIVDGLPADGLLGNANGQAGVGLLNGLLGSGDAVSGQPVVGSDASDSDQVRAVGSGGGLTNRLPVLGGEGVNTNGIGLNRLLGRRALHASRAYQSGDDAYSSDMGDQDLSQDDGYKEGQLGRYDSRYGSDRSGPSIRHFLANSYKHGGVKPSSDQAPDNSDSMYQKRSMFGFLGNQNDQVADQSNSPANPQPESQPGPQSTDTNPDSTAQSGGVLSWLGLGNMI
ncbi:hypothetical protein PGT21_001413 [Puccinia graminis f. sp. tritici]|uniref:Uncharacterized protein n=1 Tax=Puccinia graminis f. sp. tritici TaxID=56615 RepID=A0A5B0NM90_PUCGR|nr:hypothetical protein PGT21_001413 [Puccinia graminis f. sp. tritici]